MNLAGLSATNQADRVESGQGIVHERTIEIGDTVILLANIGAMRLIDPKPDHGLAIVGGVILVLGLLTIQIVSGIGILMALVGAAMIARSFLRPVDLFLSIGTCDGRQLNIVSRNRQFLLEFRTFLRTKIDLNDMSTATFNISNTKMEITAGSISGGIAMGDGSYATGASGSVRND